MKKEYSWKFTIGLITGLAMFMVIAANAPQIFNRIKVTDAILCNAFYGLDGSFKFYADDGAAASAATALNTASTIVKRDGSGNFAAGTITASLSGNASTSTTATNAANSAIADDTSTNATMYPIWVTANTGNLPIKVSSSKLTFNPSTGKLATTKIETSNITVPMVSSSLHNELFGASVGNLTMTGQKNIGLGVDSLNFNTTGSSNVFAGDGTLLFNTEGNYNVAHGCNVLRNNTTGYFNTGTGCGTLTTNVIGNENTAFGSQALYYTVGSGNVGLGFCAGMFETGSNAFYVDNQNRVNTAGEKAGALMYGTFNANPTLQTLKINAATSVISLNSLYLAAQATGFFIEGGTASKTLTVPLDASVSGTNTGDDKLYTTTGPATLTVGAIADGQYLKRDGNTIISATPAGTGDVSKVGTPVDNQVGVWTGDGTIEGTAGLTYDGSNFLLIGDIGATGTRITKGWFADLTVTNAIAGGITGNAATATAAGKSTNLVGGNNTTLLGSIPYQSNTDTTTLLGPNTTTTKKFLNQTGDATNGAAPQWDAVTKTDVGLSSVENTALSTWAGTANITTLGTVTTGTLSTGAVIGGVTMTLGSDAGLDMYYRSAGGVLTRLAKGTALQALRMNSDASAIEWATSAAFDITGLSAITAPAQDDYIPVYDTSASANKKITLGNIRQDVNNDQVDSYTLVLTDAGKTVWMNKGSANVLTIPANASVAFPVNTTIVVLQEGAGATTITAGAGVTLNGVSAGSILIGSQYGTYLLTKRATDTWTAVGGTPTTASGWGTISTAKYTATPASTSTITMSDTSDCAVGRPVKFAIGGTTYYAVITTVTTNTSIAIAGAPMGGDLTSLYIGGSEKIVQADFFISGTYGNGTGDLLAADMNTYFKWGLGKAYLVTFSCIQKTVDTGTEPKINVKVNTAAVSTNDTNKGVQLGATATWVDNSAVAINTSNYDINRGEVVDINCSEAGGTGDAADLTVTCTFVLE